MVIPVVDIIHRGEGAVTQIRDAPPLVWASSWKQGRPCGIMSSKRWFALYLGRVLYTMGFTGCNAALACQNSTGIEYTEASRAPNIDYKSAYHQPQGRRGFLN